MVRFRSSVRYTFNIREKSRETRPGRELEIDSLAIPLISSCVPRTRTHLEIEESVEQRDVIVGIDVLLDETATGKKNRKN